MQGTGKPLTGILCKLADGEPEMRNQKFDLLETQLFKAAKHALIAMGPDVKKLSWFGRNHVGASEVDRIAA